MQQVPKKGRSYSESRGDQLGGGHNQQNLVGRSGGCSL